MDETTETGKKFRTFLQGVIALLITPILIPITFFAFATIPAPAFLVLFLPSPFNPNPVWRGLGLGSDFPQALIIGILDLLLISTFVYFWVRVLQHSLVFTSAKKFGYRLGMYLLFTFLVIILLYVFQLIRGDLLIS